MFTQTTSELHALVIADRNYPAHEFFGEDTCPASTHLVGKPAIDYTLEELAVAGIRRATVVVSTGVTHLREHLGGGEKWGLNLTVTSSRGDESVSAIGEQLGASLPRPCLVLRGDLLRTRVVERLMGESGAAERVVRCCNGSGQVLAVRVQEGALPDFLSDGRTVGVAQDGDVRVDSARLLPLDTPAALHAASCAILEEALGPLEVAGVVRSAHLRCGKLSRINPSQVAQGLTFAGDFTFAESGVRLTGRNVIGANSFIDQDSQLHDCVVLPGTYVGVGLTLRDMVVSSRQMCAVSAGGAIMPVADSLWLDAIEAPSGATGFVERLLGLFLLAATLPLQVLALALALGSAPRRPLRALRLIGNRRDALDQPTAFGAWRWSGPVAALAGLPGLLDVVRGHLRLVGARAEVFGRPVTTDHPLPVGSSPPAGLISAARLLVGAGAPEEEVWATEAVLAHHGLVGRLSAVLRGLIGRLSGRAERSAGHPD